MWNVVEPEEIKPHTLEIMNYVKPRPDYLIIGTGETNVLLDDTFYEHFKRMGISVDTCPTFEACSTFNMCIEDDYNVACALLQPLIPTNPDGTESMPKEVWDEEAQRISGFIGLANESFGKPKEIRSQEQQLIDSLKNK